MPGSIYATRVTVVTNAMGSTNINDGEPTYIHTVLISSTTAVTDQSFFESGVPQGSSITNQVGEAVVDVNTPLEWNPYTLFDKGFRVDAPDAGVFVTVTWRADG